MFAPLCFFRPRLSLTGPHRRAMRTPRYAARLPSRGTRSVGPCRSRNPANRHRSIQTAIKPPGGFSRRPFDRCLSDQAMCHRSQYSSSLTYDFICAYRLTGRPTPISNPSSRSLDNMSEPMDISAQEIGRIAAPKGSRQRQSRRKAATQSCGATARNGARHAGRAAERTLS